MQEIIYKLTLALVVVLSMSATAIAQSPATTTAPPTEPTPTAENAQSEPAVDNSPPPNFPASLVPPPAKAPTTAPDAAPAGFEAAVKLYTSGKYPQAVAQFEGFIKAGTANSKTHEYLAGCYQSMKKWDKALQQYDWVAKNAPLVSTRRTAEKTAHTLRCYRAGICPGNCLKRSMPGWRHYPDMDPNKLWMKYTYSNAQGHGWHAFSDSHLGEVIEFVNGVPVNKGRCTICGGTGEVEKLK